MANSKFEYVKGYESHDRLLPSTYIVIRIDGRSFHRLSHRYQFDKPNDVRALNLMNASAVAVLDELPDISVAYGVSDEFSFVFRKTTELFERRREKLLTTVVSTFTASYLHLWPKYFPTTCLSQPLPSFDGRAVLYPNDTVLRDYLSWRQVDCHINNLYNTVFWALVRKDGLSEVKAEQELRGTVASDKNEILFSRFGINYNNEPNLYRKGTVIYRSYKNLEQSQKSDSTTEQPHGLSMTRNRKGEKGNDKARIVIEHVDIVKDVFWEDKPWLLT